VQDAAARFGWWDFGTPPRGEDELYDLHQVRRLAQRLGLARRSRRKLGLTAKGKALLGDPGDLWRTTARGVLPRDSFGLAVGEVTLAILATGSTVPSEDLQAVVTEIVLEEGWRDTSSHMPPEQHTISRTIRTTTNLFGALNLLATGGDWNDRSYGLSDVGQATALEALHHRATGPRPSPW